MHHKKTCWAFELVITEEPPLEEHFSGKSGLLKNPDNWEPDCPFFPDQRQGQMGSNDETTPNQTIILKVATN